MTTETETLRGAAGVSVRETPQFPARPATFDFISAVSRQVPRFDGLGQIVEGVLDSTNSCKVLDAVFAQRLGVRSLLDLKAATVQLSGEPQFVGSFPEAVRQRALKWAGEGLDKFQERAEAEDREERRLLSMALQGEQKPWSNPRKSGLSKGPGSHEGLTRRDKRHKGRGRSSNDEMLVRLRIHS